MVNKKSLNRIVLILLIFTFIFGTALTIYGNEEEDEDYSAVCVQLDGNYDTLSYFLDSQYIPTTKLFLEMIDENHDILSSAARHTPSKDSLYDYHLYKLLHDSIYSSQYGTWTDSVFKECMEIFDNYSLISKDSNIIFSDSNFIEKSDKLKKI